MTFIITKYLATAFIVVLVSEIAKKSDKLGALISSLPLVTIMVLLWLYFEKQSIEKIAYHAYYTFWYVLPTLPMFLIIPKLLQNGMSFIVSLFIGIGVTFINFIIIVFVGRYWGVELIP